MKEDHKVELHRYREELMRQKENWSEKTDLSGSWRKKKNPPRPSQERQGRIQLWEDPERHENVKEKSNQN